MRRGHGCHPTRDEQRSMDGVRHWLPMSSGIRRVADHLPDWLGHPWSVAYRGTNSGNRRRYRGALYAVPPLQRGDETDHGGLSGDRCNGMAKRKLGQHCRDRHTCGDHNGNRDSFVTQKA